VIKAEPREGLSANSCGTAFACVTVEDRAEDVKDAVALRSQVPNMSDTANAMRHVYMNQMRREVFPELALDAEAFRERAQRNTANRTINRRAGLGAKADSLYSTLGSTASSPISQPGRSSGPRVCSTLTGPFSFLRTSTCVATGETPHWR
jgi:hypothetical protein